MSNEPGCWVRANSAGSNPSRLDGGDARTELARFLTEDAPEVGALARPYAVEGLRTVGSLDPRGDLVDTLVRSRNQFWQAH
ncbi:hypothetical protein [Nocardia cyriacigeorgica]|uniref:hypothetical protein n=1 Tax=Nocardia cyriacigeorgica TaxID=135487 RepID=UPI0024569D96|nr:hypothetical protein [Nocardia cyriacigeorgica]